MKSLIQIGLCLMLVLQFASESRAQFEIGEDEQQMMKKEMDNRIAAWSKSNEQKMGLHLDEIQRLTGLTDDQLKKIRIGAKGQVKKHGREYGKRQEEMEKKMQSLEFSELDSFLSEADSFKMTYRSESWHRFLETQLSQEQYEKVQQAQKQRKANADSTAVKTLAHRHARSLLLSDEQSAGMLKILQEHLRDRILGGKFMGSMPPGMQTEESEADKKLRKKLQPLLKDLLSDRQLAFWNKHLFGEFVDSAGGVFGGSPGDDDPAGDDGPNGDKADLFQEDMANIMEPMLKSISQVAAGLFELQIEHLTATCKLSETKKQELQKEAKKFIEQWREDVLEFESMVNPMEPRSSVDGGSMPTMDPYELVQDKRWQELLNNRLSADQRELYQKEKQKRQESYNNFMVKNIANALDDSLLCSPEQLEKLKPVIKSQLIDTLNAALGNSSLRMVDLLFGDFRLEMGGMLPGAIIMGPGMMGGGGPQSKPAELAFEDSQGNMVKLDEQKLNSSLGEILGDKQMQVWKEDIWPMVQTELSFAAQRGR